MSRTLASGSSPARSLRQRVHRLTVRLFLPVFAVALTLAASVVGTGGTTIPHATAATSITNWVYAWGDNEYGKVGTGSTSPATVWTPTRVSGQPLDAKAVVGNLDYSLALMSDGTVWTWGGNLSGYMGVGTSCNYSTQANCSFTTPVQVPGLTAITALAGGGDHSMALDSSGYVWSWGDNYFGAVGDGTTSTRLSPVRLNLPQMTAIAAGDGFSMALDVNGYVWTWGYNDYGQLGNGSIGGSSPTPRAVKSVAHVIRIAAGREFALAEMSNGVVLGWGNNNYGQLALATATTCNSTPYVKPCAYAVPVQTSLATTNITQLAAGGSFAMALLSNGRVISWGSNTFGELGDGTTVSRWQPKYVQGPINVRAIAAGVIGFGLAVGTDATGYDGIWTWGYDTEGELGMGSGYIGGATPGEISLRNYAIHGAGGVTVGSGYDHALAIILVPLIILG